MNKIRFDDILFKRYNPLAYMTKPEELEGKTPDGSKSFELEPPPEFNKVDMVEPSGNLIYKQLR